MKFSSSNFGGTVEILVGLTDMHTLTPVKVAEPDSSADSPIVKAGTPLDADGAAANTASAVGILLYDVDTSVNPNGTMVQSGPIDAAKAQAHSGVTYDTAMIDALSSITFRTNIGVNP